MTSERLFFALSPLLERDDSHVTQCSEVATQMSLSLRGCSLTVRELSAAISFSGLTATKILAHGHENSGLVATRIPV